MLVEVSHLEQMQALAKQMALEVSPNTVILLDGPMGAGKTRWVHFFVEALGGKDVTSPTFVFHQEYPTKKLKIHHFDFYRIQNSEDLESTGFWDFFTETNSVIVVEWASRLPQNSLPNHWKTRQIEIDFKNDQRWVNLI